MKLFLALLLITFNVFSKEILLTEQNTVFLTGPVTDRSIAQITDDLVKVSNVGKSNEPVYLVLNTPGGSVMAGLDLMAFMNTLRRPVHVVANYAASMGFHILQSSKVRYVTKFGTIMSHRARGGFSGEIPQQVNSRLKHVIDLVTKMDEHVVSRTNGKHTLSSYSELIRDEYYAVGSNAIKDGFADSIAELKCSKELLEGKIKRTVQVFIFTAELTFSKCPLITNPVADDNSEQTKKVIKGLKTLRNYEL